MSPKRYLGITLSTAIAALATWSGVSLAANAADIDARATTALNHFEAQSDQHRDLVQKASAILVFPRITKAGAGVGGEFGEGALQVAGHSAGNYKVTGGSIGATLGVARYSEVILFMTHAARDHFLSTHDWSIGADANVAIVKKGVGGDYDTETLRKPVLAFVFNEKGLLGDVSLQGAKISKLPAAAESH